MSRARTDTRIDDTGTAVTDAEQDARSAAGWDVQARIRRLAADGYGATLTETPIEGYRILTRSGMDDPLAGVRAAMQVRAVAAGEIRSYVDQARGAGTTWAQIAEVLGVVVEDGEYHSPGEIAYRHLVEHEPLPAQRDGWSRFDRTYTVWTCISCGARVRDAGPFESHPDDNETGHASGCARHAAEIAEWRARTGWDEE